MDFKKSPRIVQTTKSQVYWEAELTWVKPNMEANGRGSAESNSWIFGLDKRTDAETHSWMAVYDLGRKTMSSIFGHADACGFSSWRPKKTARHTGQAQERSLSW